MIHKSATAKNQEIIEFAPAWMDGERVVGVDLPQKADWSPDEHFGALERGRGDIIALVKITKACTGHWISRISGSDDYEEVPNFTDPEFEVLRQWRWTGFQWREATR